MRFARLILITLMTAASTQAGSQETADALLARQSAVSSPEPAPAEPRGRPATDAAPAGYAGTLAAYADARAKYEAALHRHEADVAAYQAAAQTWAMQVRPCPPHCPPEPPTQPQPDPPYRTLKRIPPEAQPSTSTTFSMPAALSAEMSSPTVLSNSTESLLLNTRLEP